MAKTINLMLTSEQIDLMRTALLEYQKTIRQEERYHCAGLSTVGIELCRRRLVLDAVLSEVELQSRTASRSTLRLKLEPVPA